MSGPVQKDQYSIPRTANGDGSTRWVRYQYGLHCTANGDGSTHVGPGTSSFQDQCEKINIAYLTRPMGTILTNQDHILKFMHDPCFLAVLINTARIN